jgi:hypothetical protein
MLKTRIARKRSVSKTANFNKKNYEARIKMLTDRAKTKDPHKGDLDLGEIFYIEILKAYIANFRAGNITAEKLTERQKAIETALLQYYQQQEMFKNSIEINNRYSHILTEAEKHGCPICKKLVRVFDGRDLE